MGRQQAGNRTGDGSATGGQSDRRWAGNRRAVGQAMGRQQAGSRTGDGPATGGQSDRRWVGNRVRQQVGSQAGGVRQQAGSQAGGVRQQAGKLEHKLALAGDPRLK